MQLIGSGPPRRLQSQIHRSISWGATLSAPPFTCLFAVSQSLRASTMPAEVVVEGKSYPQAPGVSSAEAFRSYQDVLGVPR